MKKTLILLLILFSVMFAGCGNSKETVIERQSDDSPESSSEPVEDDTLVKKNLLTVDVTIPATFYQREDEEITQEKIDQIVKDSNFNSGKLNDDGSVTFKMGKAQHAEFLQSLKDSVTETIDGFINGDDRIESFTKISFNDDMSKFSVYVDSSKYSNFDALGALSFYIAGEYYQLFNGVALNDTDVQVDFIDKDTDEVLNSAKLSEMRKNSTAESESASGEDLPTTDVEDDLTEKLEVTGEYFYTNSIDDTLYCLTVKNNSSLDLEISVNAIAKDGTGASIGATSTTEEAVAPGGEACLVCYFSSTKDATAFEYTLEAKENDYYSSITDDLELKTNDTGEKVVIECKNTGNDIAKSVEAIAIFLQDGKMVYYDSAYLTDNDSELKPGKSIASDIDSYKKYDEVKIFISGYKRK